MFYGALSSIALFSLAILLPTQAAYAQRPFMTVDPSDLAEGLRFDTNAVPALERDPQTCQLQPLLCQDLNFSPNIIFPPGSNMGFVSYPGSDKILVFDAETGEVVELLEVGANPALISSAPNGQTLAVPSLFLKENTPQGINFESQRIGSISLIDVDTLEVRTIELTNVFLSFANNIVFSADGQTGFIASSGTDEILRFDVETATELTPRLEMPDGTRPSSLTRDPGGEFFTAVLVGSTQLAIQDVPDSVAVIDIPSFSRLRSLAPPVPVPDAEDNVLPADFRAVNVVSLSQDGEFALITDQLISTRSQIPAIAVDRAFLFNVGTGELVKTFNTGGLASFSAYVPQLNVFVVLSALQIDVIDLETLEVKATSLPFSAGEILETARPTFSEDGRLMYLPGPLQNLLLVYDIVNTAVLSSSQVAEPVEVGEGDNTTTIPAAPMDVALTSDQEIFATVNFNANTISLLRPNRNFSVPRVLATDEWFTGVAITNLSSREAEIIALGFNNQGVRLQDLLDTEDVVEYVNPATVTLGPGEQLAETGAELMTAAAGQTFEGWFKLDSDELQIGSFFLNGDVQGKRLDGAVSAFEIGRSFILPEVRVTDGFAMEVVAANPNLNSTEVTFTLFDHEGEELAEATRTAGISDIVVEFVRDPTPSDDNEVGLFADSVFENFAGGYLLISSDSPVSVYGRYFDAERMAALNGISMTAPAPDPSDLFFVPQIAVFGGSDSFVKLVNIGETTATITATFRDNTGTVISAPVTLELAAKEAERRSLIDLFGLADPGQTLGGSLFVEVTGSRVVGSVEVQIFSGKAMSAIAFQETAAEELLFSHVATGRGFSTGLALLYPGSDQAAVLIEVFDPAGTLTGSTTVTLGPGQLRVQLLDQYIQGLPEQVGGYIRVTSTGAPIIGLQLFFSDDMEMLSAVPGQSIATL
ncbi:MAG: YncE family protein [Acidobacteriota bacterium]